MTTISQPFCQKSLFGGIDTATYCGDNNNDAPILDLVQVILHVQEMK